MTEDQTNLLQVDSWQILFPEIAVESTPQLYGIDNRTGNGTARSGIDNRDSTTAESCIVESYEAAPLSSATSLYYYSSEDLKGSHHGESGHAAEPQGPDAISIPESPIASLMDRPPVQVMQRDGKFDTDRIPSSVFDTNGPSSPADWSAASTESLFSIHLQKPSIGRELSFTPHDESGKSVDAKSGKIPLLSPSNPQTPAETVGDERTNESKGDAERKTVMHGAQKDMGKTYPVDPVEEKVSPAAAVVHRSSMSRNANDNEPSTTSCAFPLAKCCKCCKISFPSCKISFPCRKKKCFCHRKTCAWSSCFCCNCSWFCCHKCKWPKFSCTWPSCSCCRCKWAFCSCWTCGLKRLCCCLSMTKSTVADQNGAVNGDSKASTGKKCCSSRFSCFSCVSCSSCRPSWGSCGAWFSCSKCCSCLPCLSCRLWCC